MSKDYIFGGKTEDLILTIKNSGGPAHNVGIRLQPEHGNKISYELPTSIIPEMLAGGKETVKIPITADSNIMGTQETQLQIELLAENGTELARTKFRIRLIGPVPIER